MSDASAQKEPFTVKRSRYGWLANIGRFSLSVHEDLKAASVYVDTSQATMMQPMFTVNRILGEGLDALLGRTLEEWERRMKSTQTSLRSGVMHDLERAIANLPKNGQNASAGSILMEIEKHKPQRGNGAVSDRLTQTRQRTEDSEPISGSTVRFMQDQQAKLPSFSESSARGGLEQELDPIVTGCVLKQSEDEAGLLDSFGRWKDEIFTRLTKLIEEDRACKVEGSPRAQRIESSY